MNASLALMLVMPLLLATTLWVPSLALVMPVTLVVEQPVRTSTNAHWGHTRAALLSLRNSAPTQLVPSLV